MLQHNYTTITTYKIIADYHLYFSDLNVLQIYFLNNVNFAITRLFYNFAPC